MDFIKRLYKSKLAQNGIWLLILQIFNTIVPLLTLPYITRILSSSAYGEFSIALNWVGYFQVIVEYGFGLTGARKTATAKTAEELRQIRSSIIASRIILFLVCLILFAVLAVVNGMQKTQLICMVILLTMVFTVIFQQKWFFQGISEMKNIAVINMISRSVSVVLIFLLVKKPEDLYLYCLLYISNYIISVIIENFVVSKKYKVGLSQITFKEIKSEIREGWELFVSSAISKVFGSLGITILGLVATNSQVGIYSAINKIPYVIILLFSAISQALYPQMCKVFSSSFDNGLSAVKKYCLPILSFFSLGCLFLILFNKTVVNIAFGAEYADFSMLLLPMSLWVILSVLNNFLGIQILVASGHQKEYSRAFTVSFLVMVVLMALLGYFWSSYGIAYATMFSELALTVLLFISVCKVKTING